jgi:beta-galactosidase
MTIYENPSKSTTHPALIAACLFSSIAIHAAEPLAGGWRFTTGDPPDALKAGTGSWREVTIPHTWNAADAADGGGHEPPGDPGYYRGPAWYARDLKADPAWKDQRVFLRFGAVSSVAEVFLNGRPMAEHKGPATAFAFEITGALKPGGANDLRVRADNTLRPDVPPLSGDFPVFGGIYRTVETIVKPNVCISPLDHASSGVRVFQREVSKASATIEVVTTLDNGRDAEATVDVEVRILDGKTVAARAVERGVKVPARGVSRTTATLKIDHPHLWHGRRDPHLHQVAVRVLDGGKETDRVVQPLGLRFYQVDPEKGFVLNGEPYMLRGVCRHQDRAGKGWAVSNADLKEDLDLILEMGARAVRLAHYPHTEEFYRLCDEAGLLVWTEIPVVDKISDDPGFAPNAKQQLVEMIRQLGNHPSVFAWGISNELFHRPTPDGMPLMRELHQLAKSEDPTRPTTIAVNKKREDLCTVTDLVGFNGYPGWYGGGPSGMKGWLTDYQKLGGNRGVSVSEYGAGASIKQHEQNPKQPQPGGKWHPEEWQAVVHEENWRCIREADYCWGSFIWNMFDFASEWRNEGDAPGMNDKGLVTYDRQTRKDAFYFYKANWSDEPVLHLTSKRHTTRKQADTPVKVYSNAPEVTLTLNGARIGTAKTDGLRIARWESVKLQPGGNRIEVRAERDGKILSDQAEWVLEP